MNPTIQTNAVSETRYALVGWLAILASLLILPVFVLGLVLQPKLPLLWPLMLVYIPLVLVQTGCSIYALYRFRTLLNERYQFHDADIPITVLILGTVVIGIIALSGKVALTLRIVPLLAAIPWLGFLVLVGVPLGIVGIVFGVRLLRLRDDLWGLLKPLAISTIAASVCYITFILAPLGGLIDAACTGMLGLVFLRASNGVPDVDFV